MYPFFFVSGGAEVGGGVGVAGVSAAEGSLTRPNGITPFFFGGVGVDGDGSEGSEPDGC